MKIILLIIAALLSVTAIRSAFISGPFNNNTFFFAGLAAGVFVYGWFFGKLKKMRWLTITIISMFISLAGFAVFLAMYGNRTTALYNEEFVIVLGAGVRQGRIMPPLRMRLEMALKYHERNPNAIIVVSGGTGYGELHSESYVMANFLIAHGIPAGQIIKENYSTSTFENLLFTRMILERYTCFDARPTAVIITNRFHIFRGVSFANRMGFDARSYPAPTPRGSILSMYPREVAAVIKMWIIGT